MMQRIRRWLAPPTFADDVEKNRVARLAHTILLATVGMVSLASVIVALTLRNYLVMGGTYVCFVAPVILALFILRRGHVRAASLLTTLMLWLVLIVMGFLFGGVVNTSFTTVVIVIMIAALLLGGRAGVIVAIWSFVAVTAIFASEILGFLPPPLGANVPINYWVTHTVNYAIAAMLLYLAMGNLTSAIQRAQRLAVESESQREQLQTLVQERTQDAERNARYLRATTAVARESAAVLGDPERLLAHVVDVIGAQFGFYHVGVYLMNVDETGVAWVEMRAASSPGGQQLLAQRHRLRVGVEGMIGDVAQRGVYRVAEDVRRDVTYRRTPELPDTRAELALPLRMRDEIIGVLDVQCAEMRRFNPQDVEILQALADQVAIALSNARMFEQTRQAAEAERRAYGALTADAWQSIVQARQTLGFYSDVHSGVAASDMWRPEMKTALQTGATTYDLQKARRLAVPIKVRGAVIGVIDFSKPDADNPWTPEEMALVEALTEQLSVALESARLYQDTQRRAAREQLIGVVTARMRESLDLQTVLKTTADEVRRAFGLEDLMISLTTAGALDAEVQEN